MKKIRLAFRLNLLLFLLEAFATLWMFSGASSGNLSSGNFGALKYFTVESNILMGIAALMMAIAQQKVLKGQRKDQEKNTGLDTGKQAESGSLEVPLSIYILKLMGTVSVSLTMLVTVFYLTPLYAEEYGLFCNFTNSNFFLHLVNPLLSIVIFVCFEKTNRLTLKHVGLGTLPMVLYCFYYVSNCLSHLQDGNIVPKYDWYGFFFAGVKSVLIVVPLMIILTFGIGLALWRLNRQRV